MAAIPVREALAGFGDAPRSFHRPDLASWLKAMSVWLGAGVVGVWLAGTRYCEP